MTENTTQGKAKLPCDDCDKELGTKQTLASHMKTFHDGFQGIKNLFTTPTRPPTKSKNLFSDKAQQNSQVNVSNRGSDETSESIEAEDAELYELAEDTDDEIIAIELNRMAAQYGYTGPCKECKMGKEVIEHQAKEIKILESKIETMKRRIKKTDEKKNELFREKNKALTENVQLKNELITNKTALDEANKKSKQPDIAAIDQHCKHCKFKCKDSNSMISHVAYVHSSFPCQICNEIFTSNAAMKNHVKKHLNNELRYTCGVCKNIYKTIEEAKDHAIKVCGSIQKSGSSREKSSTDTHTCNSCNMSFTNNEALEKHVEEQHNMFDCNKCNTLFNSQADVYKHANKCSEILGPYMCDKCNRELISKLGLKKHMERCQGDANEQKKKEPCNNGPDCRFLKENRCNFEHKQAQEKPWKKIQHKRQGRKQPQSNSKKPQERHYQQSKQQPRQHQQVKHHQSSSFPKSHEQAKHVCRNGPQCIYLKHNRCNYFHEEPRQRRQSPGNHTKVVDQQQDGSSSPLRPCKFGNRCNQGVDCSFLHLPKDFLPQPGGRRN